MKKDVLNFRNFKLGLELICFLFWFFFALCAVLYIFTASPTLGDMNKFGINLLKHYPVLAGLTMIYAVGPYLYRDYKRQQKEKDNEKLNLR